MKDYSKRETNIKGDKGEQWFYDWCCSKGYVVLKVGKDDFLGYESGIDFITQIVGSDNVAKWDVKCDSVMHNTGNMFIEIYSDLDKKELGWYYTSKAKNYCYIDEYNEILYLFTKKSLTLYMEEFQPKTAICVDDFRNFIKKRQGRLVNISQFEKWCKENNQKFVKEYRCIDFDDEL